VLERFVVASVHAGETEVLHAVAGRAQRDEPLQALYVSLIVVRPDLVAFNRMSFSPATTHLATVPCSAIDGAPHEVPLPLRQEATEIREPACRRDEFDGQDRFWNVAKAVIAWLVFHP
jgi:hypothetical protein